MDLISYALSKKYTKESLLGGGAVVGKNVTVSSITPIDGGNRVTFSYTLDDGTVKTSAMDVMDGNGITKVEKIKTVDLIDTYRMTFDDGSTFDYQINNGGGSSADEKVKLNSTAKEAKYLNELIDNATIKVDTDNNYLVVKKIEGQTVTVADINFLTGIKSNVQEQINNLSKSMTMYGVFDTKADLLASVDPVPVDGNTAIVVADEDNNNKQMTYIYIASTSKWTQVAESSIKIRDFTTNPINLSTEVTGKLAENKIDTAIARLADVLDKATYKGSSDGVVKQADTLTGLTYTITALNNAIKDSHTHTNKTVLDKIISNGLGSSFLADNGEYISILSIGTSEPAYTSQIWIDNTDTSKPKLKIYDGTDWIVVTGASSSDSTNYTVTLVDEEVSVGEKSKQTLKQGTGDKEKTIGTIVVPDLKMEVKATPNDGYLKTYQFTYGTGSAFEIDIPKDLVVTAGEIIVVNSSNPVSGLTDGTYLKLTIANQANPVYINTNSLVDVYTGKATTDGVSVSISDTNEISATLVGKAVSEANLDDALAQKIGDLESALTWGTIA